MRSRYTNKPYVYVSLTHGLKQKNRIFDYMIKLPLLYTAAFSILASVTALAPASAQQLRPPVGQWNTYLPYGTVLDFDSDGTTFFCVSTSAFFTYNTKDGGVTAYSKANGMSDVDMAKVGYDASTGMAVLIYQNGNIDLFKDGQFYNIPDFKITTVAGDKTIYDLYCSDGHAYISTGIGLLVVNLTKREIKETIPFFEGTAQGLNRASSGSGTDIYAATSVGLFHTLTTNPLMVNYASWEHISSNNFTSVCKSGDNVYAVSGDGIYKLQNNVPVLIHSSNNNITRLQPASDGHLWVLTRGNNGAAPYVVKIDAAGAVQDSIPNFYANAFMDSGDGKYWSSDGYAGLKSRSVNGNPNDWTSTNPAGPYTNGAYGVWANNGEFWLAHGARGLSDWFVKLNQDYVAQYNNGDWRLFKWDMLATTSSPFAFTDALNIVKDESSADVYVAMYNGGIARIDKDNRITVYKQGYLESNMGGDTASYRCTDVALDGDNNLWITQSTVQNVLRVKTKAGNWYSYRVNGVNHGSSLLIDDLGQKWFAAGTTGGGLAIYNDNNTLDNTNDDRSVVLRSGAGSGNLPNNRVLSLAKDKDGSVWVGTSSGIAIYNCDLDIRNGICDAYLKPLQTEGYNFANYMFEGIAVNAIAIDGGNRKWIGTDVGLFLLSEDAEDIIAQYTEANSPLLSNTIINIDIDPTIGTVFVSTDKGLCSFGGAATEAGGTVTKPLFVFPNPVPSGYNGNIAIKGMTAASNVKITDINGQLVYQGTSTGGQIAWNGRDYTGRKVQSGVYLVFVVSKDGTEKATGKFIIHE
ncbi:Two component regulator propeller [compost metagenome]